MWIRIVSSAQLHKLIPDDTAPELPPSLVLQPHLVWIGEATGTVHPIGAVIERLSPAHIEYA